MKRKWSKGKERDAGRNLDPLIGKAVMKDITYGADVSISDTSSTLFAGSQEAQRESLLVLELVLNLGERVSFRERCFSTS